MHRPSAHAHPDHVRRAHRSRVEPLVRGFLLRIVLFTARTALDQTPFWRALTSAADIDVVAIRCGGAGGARDSHVVGLTRKNGRGAPVLRVTAGDTLPPEELAARLASWDAEIGLVIDGAEAPPLELLGAPRFGSHVVRDGWLGASGGIATAEGVAAALVDIGRPESPGGGWLSSGRAPAYPDDSLADLERRATELAVAVVRDAIHRLRARAGRGHATPETINPWPTGFHRARAAIALHARRALRRGLDPRRLVKTAAALVVLALVASVRHAWRTMRRRHAVHVFTFHRVSELCRDGMTVRPSVFARQVAAIQRSHRVVGLGEAIELVAHGARLTRPVAAITFDDAYRSVIDVAAPVMARAGITGCCFVSTDIVGAGRRFAHDADNPVRAFLEVMNWGEIDLLQDAGWEIGGHTATHARLSRCTAAELDRELTESAAVMCSHTSESPAAFAYPFGGVADITPLARRMVAAAGYRACLSDFGGENLPPGDPLAMRRIELGGDHDALAWRVRLRGLDLADWRPRWLRPTAQGAEVMHAA